MFGGVSSSCGVVFYDMRLKGDNAIYCYYDGDTPRYKTGQRDALVEEMQQQDQKYIQEPKGILGKIILAILAVLIGCVVLTVKLVGGFFPILGSVLFAVISIFPLATVMYSTVRVYPDEGDFHRFRRFHAAEHMAINYAAKLKKEMILEEYRRCNYFHGECGTVLSGSLVVFAGILWYALSTIPAVGFGKACLTVLIGIVALIVNIFNPLNPLKLCQIFAVEKPTDRELTLVLEAIKWIRTEYFETEKQ